MTTRQSFEIEYEVVDLEGDLDGAPLGLARARRGLDEEIAMLSGGLFDRLPKVEVPLETFFPQTPEPSYWSRPRSDSLPPVEACVAEEAPPRRVGPGWFVGMAAAAVVGMAVGVVTQRPQMQPIVLQPASAAHVLPGPSRAAEPAPEAVATVPVAPVKIASGTGPVQATKAVRPATQGVRAPANVPVVPEASVPVVPEVSVPVPSAPVLAAPQGPASSSAAVAVAAAGRGASGCFEPNELRRTMAVSVTFAPSGRATRAVIEGGPHRATPVGSCIAQGLRNAVVAPFEGPPVTIHTSIHLR